MFAKILRLRALSSLSNNRSIEPASRIASARRYTRSIDQAVESILERAKREFSILKASADRKLERPGSYLAYIYLLRVPVSYTHLDVYKRQSKTMYLRRVRFMILRGPESTSPLSLIHIFGDLSNTFEWPSRGRGRTIHDTPIYCWKQ